MRDLEFECALEEHLRKCELEYRAKKKPHGSECDWLAEHCESTDSIARFLRSLGFRVKEINNIDEDCAYVVTTSGVVVYKNFADCGGFVVGTERSKR